MTFTLKVLLCTAVLLFFVMMAIDAQRSEVCFEPLKVGPCEAPTLRVYFNQATMRCEEFFWGGCQPNGNNFETLPECGAACRVDI